MYKERGRLMASAGRPTTAGVFDKRRCAIFIIGPTRRPFSFQETLVDRRVNLLEVFLFILKQFSLKGIQYFR